MEVISLKSFLNLFHKKNEVKYTVNNMLTTMTVKVGNKIHRLNKYADMKEIKEESLQLLCDHINTRDEYLTRFYNLSLSIDFSNLVISATDVIPMKNNKMNNNQEIRFKNIIRNLHMMDILHKTKSGIENVPTFFDVLFDLYFNRIIDYKLLTPSALHYIQKGRIGSVFSSYFFRASIMNPYLVYSLNQTIFKATFFVLHETSEKQCCFL